jgi:hypothetical protein
VFGDLVVQGSRSWAASPGDANCRSLFDSSTGRKQILEEMENVNSAAGGRLWRAGRNAWRQPAVGTEPWKNLYDVSLLNEMMEEKIT